MAGKKGARPGAQNVGRMGEIVAMATAPVVLPAHLIFYNDMERAYFERLLEYRSPDDWRPADYDRLKTATENWWAVQVEREILDTEDTVVIDENGKPAVNPRLRALDIHQKAHDAMLRGLGISRPAGDVRTMAKRRDDVQHAKAALVPDRLLTQARGGLTVVNGGGKK